MTSCHPHFCFALPVFIDCANTATRRVLNGFGGGAIFARNDAIHPPPRFDPHEPELLYALIETRAGLLECVKVFATEDRRDNAFYASVRNSQPDFEEMSDEQLEAAYYHYDAGDEAEYHRDVLEIIH